MFQPDFRGSTGQPGPPPSLEEKEETKTGLPRVWQIMKFLYQNEVTRYSVYVVASLFSPPLVVLV